MPKYRQSGTKRSSLFKIGDRVQATFDQGVIVDIQLSDDPDDGAICRVIFKSGARWINEDELALVVRSK